MAAPMDVSGSEEEEKNDEEIDVFSPNFNPLKALYAQNVALPVEDASIFNNLAEYERFMSKSKEEPDEARDQKSVPISRRALERRHLEHMKEKTKELPKSTRHLKKMYQLNVLSRMESKYTMESPLDLLRQCVEKRCKVRVCIRSFKGLRSICIGYLVAFDKIWNMALTDVVEIYKRPSTGKRFHHEEKVTYSMIMSNLNPPPKKPDPPVPSNMEQRGAGGGKKRAKECKFCRIKHEAIIEQRQAVEEDSQDAEDSRDADTSQSWTDTGSSWSETDDDSSTEDGISDGVKVQRTPKRPSGLCPNGHKPPRSKSKVSSQSSVDGEAEKGLPKTSDPAGLTSKRVSSTRMDSETSASLLKGSSVSKVKIAERVSVGSKEGASAKESGSVLEASSVSKAEAEMVGSRDKMTRKQTSSAKSTASASSSTAISSRKSDLLLSRMTTPATKQEFESSLVLDRPTELSQAGGSARSSSTSVPTRTTSTPSASSISLSKAFSKSLTIDKTSIKSTDSLKIQDQKEIKASKEVVHLDPKTGKRLIQPEEFKRRHVNQLFIRGDQVVMVSVDSAMVEVDIKKPVPIHEEKSVPEKK